MNHQDLRTLQILEELGNEHVPSQRDLAKKLNVSLGLVNSFMKRLAQKGYFKVRTIPRNRVKYILTPKGAAEKTRLTYKYIQHSFQFYKNARQKFRKMFKRFAEQGARRIVFFGATELAEIAFVSIRETDLELVGIADGGRHGTEFLKMKVLSPEHLRKLRFSKVVITAVEAQEKIFSGLLQVGIPREKITFFDEI